MFRGVVDLEVPHNLAVAGTHGRTPWTRAVFRTTGAGPRA